MTQLGLAPSTVVSQATRRIDAFRDRFGNAHLQLAFHAALPLALTPDLMYRLWANFQQDIHGERLDIPWVAVADVLLSSLCEEVGHELYEMDREVRTALLNQLKHDTRFGQTRLRELSDFLLIYVQQQLDSPDIDIRDRAEAQRWAAIAYTHPHEAAQELSRALATTYQNNKTECLRIAAIVETLADPLAEFEPLLTDARTKATAVRSGVTVPAPPPPKSRKTLYWAIGIATTIVLAALVYRYTSTPKPVVTSSPSPTQSVSPSPTRSPAKASPLPSPKPTVTTPAAASPSSDATAAPAPPAITQPEVTKSPSEPIVTDVRSKPAPVAATPPAQPASPASTPEPFTIPASASPDTSSPDTPSTPCNKPRCH